MPFASSLQTMSPTAAAIPEATRSPATRIRQRSTWFRDAVFERALR
jgi:hypothetical protein